MKKIATLFLRDWNDNPKHVTREPNPECAWVLAGEGIATRKYDGTCVLYDGIRWWARREVKPGKADPLNFLEADRDETTGKRIGWEPIEQSSFAKYHAEAVGAMLLGEWEIGTYELVGPRINGNPEDVDVHELVRHADAMAIDAPRDFEGLRDWLHRHVFEGVVWHHPDGRMAKLKARDMPREEITP